MKLFKDVRWFALVITFLAIALRFTPHAHNFAAFGAVGLFAACFWSGRIAFLLTIAAMAVSDLLGHFFGVAGMGFYEPSMMLLNYLGLGLGAFAGRLIQSPRQPRGCPQLIGVPVAAVLSTAVFFLVSNFGSWLSPAMGYERSLGGLLSCYWLAIPFVKNTLIGNLLFSGAFFALYAYLTADARQAASARVRDQG